MSFLNPDSYFSITDILVSEERIQCEIKQLIPNLGYLCASSKEPNLTPGLKLDIPLWLASSLSKNSAIITCEIPKIYKDSYKEILEADACAVELNKWSQYYYEIGLRLPHNNSIEVQNICKFLLEVFKCRFRIIMDLEQNPFSFQSHRSQLTILEKNLLLQGINGRLQLLNWLNKGVKHIEASNVLNNIRKRKSLNV